MNAVKTFKPALLAVAVSSVLTGFSGLASASTTVTDPTENIQIQAGEVFEVTDGSAYVFTTPPAVDGNPVTITNSGTINAGEYAIEVRAGAETGNITNDGDIIANKTAIFVNGGTVGEVFNTGTIESTEGAAIHITEEGKVGKINNGGTVIGGLINQGTDNEERIAVDTRLSGSEKLEYSLRGDSNTVGNIYLHGSGSGGVVVATATGALNNVFNGTHITGADQVLVRNKAGLTLEAQDQTIQFNLVKGAADESGKFSFGNSSTLEMKLNGNVDKDSAILDVDGDVIFGTDSKVIVSAASADISDLAGTHTLITGNSITTAGTDKFAVEGGWLIMVDDYSIVEGGEGEKDSLNADLSYNVDASSSDVVNLAKAGGADITEQAMLQAFSDIAFDGTEIEKTEITFTRDASQDLMNLIGKASDDTSAARLAGEITPDRSGATIHAIQRVQNKQLDNITDRINVLRADPLSEQGFWFRAYGNNTKKDVDGRIDGYDVTGYGMTVGIDTIESENWLAGVAFSQNNQDIETKIYDTEYTVDSYQLAMYGNWSRDKLFVNSVLNGGYSSFKSERSIGASIGYTGETRATSSFTGYNIAARVTAGMDMGTDTVMVQPMVAAELGWQNIRNHEEEGSPASLAYDDQTMNQMKLGAGLNVSTVIETASGDFIPSLTGMGWYDFKAEDHDISGHTIADPTVGGTVTTAEGSTETRFELRAGVNYAMKNGTDIGFGVSHDIEDNYHDTQLQFSLNYSF